MAKLQHEIRQAQPFGSLEEEVFLSLERTADLLIRPLERELRNHGLSVTQYNVLRILRGAGPEGHSCTETAERMVTRDPDMTRLLDRLELRGWVERGRSKQDRRVVTTRITSSGLELLATLDDPLARLVRKLLNPLGRTRLQTLANLLDAVREQCTSFDSVDYE